jgi:DNA modification methylase
MSSNALQIADRAFHDWYRFVLSYPPHLVRDYIDRFGLSRQHVLLDPFCGTGTTNVEAKLLGINSIGIEANPVPQLASRVKTSWNVDPDGLLDHVRQIADAAYAQLANDAIEDDPVIFTNGHYEHLRTLPEKQQKLLITNSISPLPLHKALILRAAITTHHDVSFYDYERLALANVLVSRISNLRFGPEVGVGKIKQDSAVIGLWLAEMQRMVDDLHSIDRHSIGHTEIHLADSRSISELVEAQSIDAVITSPPYPNEKDYSRTTRLELVLLDYVQDQPSLRALKKQLIRSNTRGVYKDDDDDRWIKHIDSIADIADQIERRRIELGKDSGFEKLYSRVTRLYFGGMARHLEELRAVLKPGARLAYVVGDQASYLRIHIPTGQILGEIAQTLGYELIGIDLFRTRIATATKKQMREEVVMLRWPG